MLSRPVSLTTAMSPSSGYNGTSATFYGGVLLEDITPPANTNQRSLIEVTGNPSVDEIIVLTRDSRAAVPIFWISDDFLNFGPNDTARASAASPGSLTADRIFGYGLADTEVRPPSHEAVVVRWASASASRACNRWIPPAGRDAGEPASASRPVTASGIQVDNLTAKEPGLQAALAADRGGSTSPVDGKSPANPAWQAGAGRGIVPPGVLCARNTGATVRLERARRGRKAGHCGSDRGAARIGRDVALAMAGRMLNLGEEGEFERISTGDASIVEHAEDDADWGDGGDGRGRNRLGCILMGIREELRGQ